MALNLANREGMKWHFFFFFARNSHTVIEEQIWWWTTCLDCPFSKILSADPTEIHMLATSWTVILPSSSKSAFTWSTLWPILCVSGYPAHWNLQQRSHHFLTLKTIIWLFHCLLSRGYFQHVKNIGTVFPQFKQNLMQTHCSFKSAIFHVYQNCKWNSMYLTSHHSTTTHVLEPYLKQEITQENIFYLHLVKEVGAGNNIILLQSLHTLLDHWYIFHSFQHW